MEHNSNYGTCKKINNIIISASRSLFHEQCSALDNLIAICIFDLFFYLTIECNFHDLGMDTCRHPRVIVRQLCKASAMSTHLKIPPKHCFELHPHNDNDNNNNNDDNDNNESADGVGTLFSLPC